MNSTEQGRYNTVPLDGPFATAFVCHRCGALVPRSGDPEGAARGLHDLFHEELDIHRRASLGKPRSV